MSIKNQNTNKTLELLAPSGDLESLKTALYFGADAVYFGDKNFSLRAGAENFTIDGIANATEIIKKAGKKAFVTANIFIKNKDIAPLTEYLKSLSKLTDSNRPDALIVSDLAGVELIKKYAKNIAIHLSTQANTQNYLTAKMYAKMGVSRIVLAREISIGEIAKIKEENPNLELEAFVHGAMCVAYAGRCLISAFKSNRSGNRGECAQQCRFEYEIREQSEKDGNYFTLTEDEKGSYILNSKDLNLIMHLNKLAQAGISSFKIEGRSKASYYVANVINAYRRAMDIAFHGKKGNLDILDAELYKSSHREFFTGFYLGEEEIKDGQYLLSSRPNTNYQFVAVVEEGQNESGLTQIQLRNRIIVGDELEILSPTENHNKTFKVESIQDLKGINIEIANKVKQSLLISIPHKLQTGDMLRKKV
ncbi:MAG: U32 family peptidase [Firmicutes bacterium]|nr:U32 family peptidase [Bacillota bacterium]